MKKIIVLEGPSGVGKDTVVTKLIERYPDTYIKMVSMTSRKMREGEREGVTYNFISRRSFESKIKSGEIFEYTIMARDGEYRGMSKSNIDRVMKTGKVQIKDCDWIGIEALRNNYPGQVYAIALCAPKEAVAERIRARGGCEKDMACRIRDYDEYRAKIEPVCDVVVCNDNLDECVDRVHELIQKS